MINRPQEEVEAEFFSWINFFELRFECEKDEKHLVSFHFTIDREHLIKTGQFPAIAEYESKEIDHYKKVLSKSKLNEFRKSVGLFTHGVGIGSFVYLRRIFEDEINSTFKNSESSNGLSSTEFMKLRMNEKIEFLKNEPPEFLTKNKSILSIGIHELEEEDCLKYYPTLKMSIELVLTEKKEKLERIQKVKKAQSELNKISAELKNK